jgi:hypothetical protein
MRKANALATIVLAHSISFTFAAPAFVQVDQKEVNKHGQTSNTRDLRSLAVLNARVFVER